MDFLSDPFVIIPLFLVVNVVIAVVFATAIIIVGTSNQLLPSLSHNHRFDSAQNDFPLISEKKEEKQKVEAAAREEVDKEGWGIDSEFKDLMSMQIAMAEAAEQKRNKVQDMEEEIQLIKRLIVTVHERELSREEKQLVKDLLIEPDTYSSNEEQDGGDAGDGRRPSEKMIEP